MPGVFTHGDFDTWSPGYLMFLAAMHNGISRLYETFGNGGADTEKRILDARGVLAHLVPAESAAADRHLVAARQQQLRRDRAAHDDLRTSRSTRITSSRTTTSRASARFRSPRSKVPPPTSLRRTPPQTNRQVELLKVLKRQHVEMQQLTAPTHRARCPARSAATSRSQQTFPAGSIVVRMDQPYSRIADALLDRQFWAPDDPQKHPYDDTGWSFTQLFNVKVVRVTDPAILKAGMKPVDDPRSAGGQARRRRLRSSPSPTPARSRCSRSSTS